MWLPQIGPQQTAIEADWCDELFFGGARGGGKSDYLLGDYLEDIDLGAVWRGIMFRKTYMELEELQIRASEIFPAVGGVYKVSKSVDFPFSNCWYFPNGATLKMRYLEHERDADGYQGHQYTWIGFDELTNHATPYGYNKLKACLRNSHGISGRIRSGGNPGGKGHIWVKARFIDVAPAYTPFDDPATGLTRMFIPSKVTDNKFLRDNKQYISLLKSSGSVELVKAWLDGDWDVVAGAFFDCWNRDKHVIKAFVIPKDWPRFRSFDWGSAKPHSVGWWAIADGSTDQPRGALIRYREWYGMREPNVGLKLTAEEVADGIIQRSGNDKFVYSVADPSCWKVDGGPSIAERMQKRGVLWRRADNQRINGWDQMRQRFVGMDGQPMIYCFDTCIDSIRTVPLLQHDDLHAEDLDSDMEDHAADDWRYACMSRPWQKPVPADVPARFPQHRTINEIMARQKRKRLDD
jgi:Terminase large subunit, T4likevirus-type, N-terminal